MAEKKFKVGIAGYGIVGKKRRQIIDTHPLLQTVAICDQAFAEVPPPDETIPTFTSYKQLLKEPLDILFVSLPNYMAAEVTVAGLARGLHVFCEKPPGRSVCDIERVIEEERKHPHLRLKYGFNHRYHDSVRAALKIVQSGEYGDILNIRGVYGKSKIIPFVGGWRAQREYAGGGILLDQGIHMVDLIRLFVGDFEEVKSYVSNDYWKHDVEDNAFALMKDRKGRIAMLHSSATQWQHRFHLDILLSEGFLELSGILSGTKSYGQEQLIIGRRDEADVGCLHEETITYLYDNSWRDEIYEFVEAIAGTSEVQYGGSADALATMKLVYQIYFADEAWRQKYDIPNPNS